MSPNPYSYLALGDSYTIGEGVPIYESFPYQTVQMLRDEGYGFYAPEIVAKTGWTTDELQAGIDAHRLLPQYDIVTLLAGVNNQYRGGDINEYCVSFISLVKQAIVFAGNNASRVFVLSIPDWGVTPFGKQSDRTGISEEIDIFNMINLRTSRTYYTNYIDITPGTREAANDDTLLAADQLHPSGKEYTRWAAQLAKQVQQQVTKS